jgi:hypothetical protein
MGDKYSVGSVRKRPKPQLSEGIDWLYDLWFNKDPSRFMKIMLSLSVLSALTAVVVKDTVPVGSAGRVARILISWRYKPTRPYCSG